MASNIKFYVSKFIQTLYDNKSVGVASNGRTNSYIYKGVNGVIIPSTINLHYDFNTTIFSYPGASFFINASDAIFLSEKIDELYMGSTASEYRGNLFSCDVWVKMYQGASYSIPYISGSSPSLKTEPAMPCHLCGLVLPNKIVQIDHIKPSSGGGDHAIIKLLRYLSNDFTNAARIGKRFNGIEPVVVLTKSDSVRRVKETDSSILERYTLTEKGNIFLSILLAACVKYYVIDSCVNSLINMQPLCPTCNNSKSNKLKNISSIKNMHDNPFYQG